MSRKCSILLKNELHRFYLRIRNICWCLVLFKKIISKQSKKISNNKMKHQQVNVDYWAMLKAMFVYGALTALCWLMLRLFSTAFMLPRRLRAQQENIQNTLQDLQRRFPDLNITEEDLKNAEKELEELAKENDDKTIGDADEESKSEEKQEHESKKTI